MDPHSTVEREPGVSVVRDRSCSHLLRVNCPRWYRDPGFVRWLNDKSTATWHTKNEGHEPSEYSDAFLHFGGEWEGSDSPTPGHPCGDGLPEHIWEELAALVLEYHGCYAETLVWLDNLE